MIQRLSSAIVSAQALRPWRHPAPVPSASSPAPGAPPHETLRDLDLFRRMPDASLAGLCALGVERRVPKGGLILECVEEDDPRAFLVLLEGEAVVSRETAEGGESLIRLLEAGDTFGESSVFDPVPCGSVVRATTAVRLLAWRREAMLRALDRWPELGVELLAGLSRQLRLLQRRVAGVCNQRAPRRLALALAGLMEDRGVRLRDAQGRRCLLLRRPPTRRRISEMAGMARETVSRLLGEWEQSGWIEKCPDGLLILDEGRLRRMAGA